MELTKTQITLVEQYLQKRKVDYLDLNIEILDHMISDIENFMDKNHSFENGFKMTILKWENHFTERSSFYLGMLYSESKIVVNKAVKEFKPFYFLYLASYFLPFIFLTKNEIQFEKNTAFMMNQVVLSLTFLSLIYVLFIFFKTVFSKQKTTYRFILRTQYVGAIFLVMTLLLQNLFTDEGVLKAVNTGFTFAGFVVTFICHHFYKKHVAVIQKFQNV